MKDVDAEIKEVQKRINDKMGVLAWDNLMPLSSDSSSAKALSNLP